MQNVTNFIDLLGENYYLDFIMQPYADEVDYEKHFVLVHYQDKKYYEQTHEYIQVKQNEIINDIKSLFQKSISDIYLEVSKRKNEEIEKFLNFNIEAVKVKLNMLKNDFYIENDKSRYCAILYDDADTQTLETFYSKRDYSSTTTNVEIKSVIQKLNSDNSKNVLPINGSDYFLEFHYQRFKLLCFLPFKLFHIGHKFIVELNKIKQMNMSGIKHQNVLNETNSNKVFKDQYLNAFCKEISNERDIYQSTFIQCYDFGIKNFTEFLKSEITENLLILPSEKINPYLDFVEDKIKKTPYFEVDNNVVDRYISKYNLENFAFPFIENKEVNKLISMSVNFHQLTEEDRTLMEDIQIDFYCYAAMIEANKIIDFLESKKTNASKASNKIENTNETENINQLSVNQAIILLDKLGVFTDKSFENVPNTKKAKLLSQLLGKNVKNIKTSLESLDKKTSVLGVGYQKDIDKIEQLLDNLE
jgi:hypothetical protein